MHTNILATCCKDRPKEKGIQGAFSGCTSSLVKKWLICFLKTPFYNMDIVEYDEIT